MSYGRRHAASDAAPFSHRRAIAALFTAFAFLLQSLVTQTHVHGASSLGGFDSLLAKVAAFDELAFSKGPEKQAPIGDDSTRCPLCQAVQHAGSFVAPATIAFYLPWQSVSFVPRALTLKEKIAARSHIWRGRAPPRD